MNFFDEFVGIPWKCRGRDADGVDCYGLVVMVYARLGVKLPLFSDTHPDDREAVRDGVESERGDWLRIAEAESCPLDLVLIREHPWHVGIVAWRGQMLHVPEGRSSVIEPYGTGRYGRRIEGFYRHKSGLVL